MKIKSREIQVLQSILKYPVISDKSTGLLEYNKYTFMVDRHADKSVIKTAINSLFDVTGVSTQSAGTPTWYYITSTPMVRMNFDPGVINAVNDVKISQFNMYPNPTNGVFTIELDGNAKYDVTVNNVLGQTVCATSITTMNTTIDLSSFEKGIYTIELKNNTATYTEKVIVE